MCTSHDVENGTESEDQRGGYQLAKWPTYPAGMRFEMGSGVAVDNAGIIYRFTRESEHCATPPLEMLCLINISEPTRQAAIS